MEKWVLKGSDALLGKSLGHSCQAVSSAVGKANVRGGGQHSKQKHIDSTPWGSNCASGVDEEKATWFSDVIMLMQI